MHMKSSEHLERENAKRSSQAFFTKKKTVAVAAETVEGIEKLFHIIYFITSKGHPYIDFSDLVKLEKLHEVEFVPSGSYENETACKDFISFCFKSTVDANIRDKVDHANFTSVLCDGSTDLGVVEKKYIYILLVNPDTIKVKVTFLHSKMGHRKICRAFVQPLNQLSKTQFCSTYCLKLCF